MGVWFVKTNLIYWSTRLDRQTRDSIKDTVGCLVGQILFSQFLGSTFWKEGIFFEKTSHSFSTVYLFSKKIINST